MSTDLMQSLGNNVSADDLELANRAMQEGGGVQLPFPTVFAWAHNGSKKMSKVGGVDFHGGWHINADGLEEMSESGELFTPFDKLTWKKETQNEGMASAYDVYTSRVLNIAPIAWRMSWLDKEGKNRAPDFDQSHTRSHLQYLCLLGQVISDGDKKQVQLIAPAVISVKGFGQTRALKEALGAWRKVIDPLRGGMNAKKLPAYTWWLTIGTHGDQPTFETVGKGSQTNDITPLKAIILNDKPTAEWMGARFIGTENFVLATSLLKESQDWLKAWKQPTTTKPVIEEPIDPQHEDLM